MCLQTNTATELQTHENVYMRVHENKIGPPILTFEMQKFVAIERRRFVMCSASITKIGFFFRLACSNSNCCSKTTFHKTLFLTAIPKMNSKQSTITHPHPHPHHTLAHNGKWIQFIYEIVNAALKYISDITHRHT